MSQTVLNNSQAIGHTDLLSGILKVQVRNEDKITEQDRVYCQNQQDELYKTLDQIAGWYNIFKAEAKKYEGKIKLKHKPNGKISVNEYDFHYRNLSSREDYTLHEFTPFKNINDLVDSHHSAIRNFISRIIGYFNNTYSVSVEAPKIDEKTLPIDFYCCPVKNVVNKELGLTLLTRCQPFWLSLFCINPNITMGKDSHFTGQPVYSQVLKLLDKDKIRQISRDTQGSESYVKRFGGYEHLVVMLFGVLKHFDSLRELEIGMKAEAHKLSHLGIDYLVRRSTLAEANIRRPQEFFASVYAYLLEKYAKFLADSRPPKSYKGQTHEPKDWEKLLYMMDSTTITLFDNILKGVGRHPKSGKKKGGMKVHTVMKYHVGVPMVVQLTSAAKHDHYLLKEVHLPKDSTLAMDRGYMDIAQFQRLTDEGVCYVTRMKKNLKYEVLKSVTYVNPEGLVTHIDQNVLFTRGELTHEARKVEIFYENKKPVVLLTNNFDFSVEDISEIYRLRWAIESLYKQLKQNFPLHFFYGDSVNAIQIQTWCVLIANLLITVLSRRIKRKCAFSQVVTMIRLTLMYYINFISFMENPDKTWDDIVAGDVQKAPPQPILFS